MPSRWCPDVRFVEVTRTELNDCLERWGHRMGAVRRPNRGWSHGLVQNGQLLGVAATDRLIRERVAGFSREEAVELSRLCIARPDLTRVILRLWRAFVLSMLAASHGYSWALSYQDAGIHTGNIYRFDGWVVVGHSRSGRDPRTGRKGRSKVIWGWCEDEAERSSRAVPSRLGTNAT